LNSNIPNNNMTASMEKPPLERIDTTGSEPGEIQDALEKAPTDQTLAAVDLDNRHAYKGDDSDGKVEWTPRGISASIFLGMLYTGSQLPLYFVGASLTFIADDLRAPGAVGWMPVANTLAIAAVVPFCGYLQDLFGKRYFGLFGAALLCVGCVVLGTAQNLAAAVAGMALTGAGAGVGELTGLAGLAEIVPVKHRGYSMAALTSFVLPFTPYVMYTEMFSTRGDATWRWGPWICLMYNGITLAGL
jgi:MFS family permease